MTINYDGIGYHWTCATCGRGGLGRYFSRENAAIMGTEHHCEREEICVGDLYADCACYRCRKTA